MTIWIEDVRAEEGAGKLWYMTLPHGRLYRWEPYDSYACSIAFVPTPPGGWT